MIRAGGTARRAGQLVRDAEASRRRERSTEGLPKRVHVHAVRWLPSHSLGLPHSPLTQVDIQHVVLCRSPSVVGGSSMDESANCTPLHHSAMASALRPSDLILCTACLHAPSPGLSPMGRTWQSSKHRQPVSHSLSPPPSLPHNDQHINFAQLTVFPSDMTALLLVRSPHMCQGRSSSVDMVSIRLLC